MKEHEWITEEVNGGHVGVDDFWVCKNCGASGGPVAFWRKSPGPSMHPFYADGSGLNLTNDCDESKEIIAKHLAEKKTEQIA